MDHAAAMRQFYDYVNAGDVDGFVAMLADDFVEHEEFEGFPPTKEGVRQFFEMLIGAFSDLRFQVEDVFAAGDKGVARNRFTGTHQGEFMGIPATGRKVDVPGIDIVRFGDDGKAVEHWGVTDTMTMMQQLGVVPEGAPA
jgi:steroid delta-isomerase-like uncharacterized protein